MANQYQKITIEHVRNVFADNGYILTSSNYVNAQTKLEFICPKRHSYRITWCNWKNGRRCGKCKLHNIDDIRSAMRLEGYSLIESLYKGTRQPLHFICPNQHRHTIRWLHWKNGGRCGVCHDLKNFSDVYTDTPWSRVIQRSQILSGRSSDELKASIKPLLEISILSDSIKECRRISIETGVVHSVDHRIPVSWFDHNDNNQIVACWAAVNLNLIPARENSTKNNNLTDDDLDVIRNSPDLRRLLSLATRVPKRYTWLIEECLRIDLTQ